MAFWLATDSRCDAESAALCADADRAVNGLQSGGVKGKLPVTIGHQYSTVALGLEPEEGVTPSWVLPLLTERVSTTQDKEMVGAAQVNRLLEDEQLTFGQELTVEAVDSSYSKPEYLYKLHQKHGNLVTIARTRGNRTFYHQYGPSEEESSDSNRGRSKEYGERFALSDSETWTEPDESATFDETSRRGKQYRIEVQAWHNMLVSGKNKPEPPLLWSSGASAELFAT